MLLLKQCSSNWRANMLKALLKVNAAALLNWLSGSGKRSGKGKSSKGK